MNDTNQTPEVEQAAREVERRKRELSQSIDDVERSGQRLAHRLGSELKPVLIGAAVVAGAAALIGVAVLVTRRRRPEGWLAPQRPPALPGVVRTLGLGLLRLAAQHAARALVQRIAAGPQLESERLGSAQ